jgi:hypothetical protein
MRRIAMFAVLVIATLALTGVPASAHGRDHGDRHRIRVPSFSVLVGSARQGGTLLIAAKVNPPRWHRKWSRTEVEELSATAVVHFASGDVEVTLTPRASKSRFKGWYKGVGYPGARSQVFRGRDIWGRPFWAPPFWMRAWTVWAKVPVAADEAIGRVAVDVTITYGDTTAIITTFGNIKPAKTEPAPEG